ncbi:MAG: SDR family NAD(P)-dependent oxidoreductase [Alphaproteobacteria bacterium]
MSEGQVAIVVGVGAGLGAALGRRFAAAGMAVALAARSDDTTGPLAVEINDSGGSARAYAVDSSDEAAVVDLFSQVESDLGAPDLVVFNTGSYGRASVIETTAADFEANWRAGCLGGFLVGRAAAKGMAARGHGTIIFTGATAALRGSANFINLAIGKFGLRALAQSMARELGPQGLHIAHTIIDGQIKHPDVPFTPEQIASGELLEPDAIAETYYQLHLQHRSAWTLELDLRPAVEKF